MNNRDPFNIRRAPSSPISPFQSILQQGAARAVSLSQQVAEQGKEAYEQSKQALQHTVSELQGAAVPQREKERRSDDNMAFAVPRNVPNFQDPARVHEDSSWGTGARNRASAAVWGNGAKKGLPMYKDKPYNYATSGKKGPWWQRRRLLALIGMVVLGWVWWDGILFSGPGRPAKQEKETSSWFSSSSKDGKVDWLARREKVKDAFLLSWKGYEQHAWGYDEYKPISKKGRQMVEPNGLGWIIIDSLDTMMIMNLTLPLANSREWISKTLNYEADHDVNTFETTIRMLGGLLSAHYLSTEFPDLAPLSNELAGPKGEDLYLEKATDLADRLLGAYESPSGVPWASVNLKTQKGIKSHADDGASSTAEATTLQLEMKYLAKLTGEVQYWTKAEKVMQVVDDNGARDGLVPIFIYADKGTFHGNNIRLGSRGDSYYEYLIKQYLQTNKQESVYETMWEETLKGAQKHLLTYSSPNNFLVLAERPGGLDGGLEPKMDHLVCFMPGTIALATTGGSTVAQAKKSGKWTAKHDENLQLARELMKTCWGMYKTTATGLAPEIAHFSLHDPPLMYEDYSLTPQLAPKSPSEEDMGLHDVDGTWKYHNDYVIKSADTHNLQRPETVESLFYMWRITGDEIYRQWGWEMFQSFMNYTAISDDGGFSSISDVTNTGKPGWRDNMESFWLAETLKYFYLLFSPSDLLPLDKVVFNTEAHPLPRFDMGKLFTTGWSRKPRKVDGSVAPSASAAVDSKAGEVKTKTLSKEAAPSDAADIKREAVDPTDADHIEAKKAEIERHNAGSSKEERAVGSKAEKPSAVDPTDMDAIEARRAELKRHDAKEELSSEVKGERSQAVDPTDMDAIEARKTEMEKSNAAILEGARAVDIGSEARMAVDPMEVDAIEAKQKELEMSNLIEKANADKAGKKEAGKAPAKGL